MARGAPDWLESAEGKHKTSYRVNYRKLGLDVRMVIPVGVIADWRAAVAPGEALIQTARKQAENLAEPKNHLITCSELVTEILEFKEASKLSAGTISQAETMYRLHIVPFLEEHCRYAVGLTSDTWRKYKVEFRKAHPESPLFNHWKFFVTLFKRAKEKGLITQYHRLEYKESRDDKREEGLIVSDDDFGRMVKAAPHVSKKWYTRILIQRFTGRRPGEVRLLRKQPIGDRPANLTWAEGRLICRLWDYDTKNRVYSEFEIHSEFLKRAVRAMWDTYPESPYLFPNENDNSRPMDKHLNGWYSILAKAKVDPNFTPHDLRHTYLTWIFKVSNDWAVICFQVSISLEEAQKTYIHFDAADTRGIAETASKKVAEMGLVA